MRTASLCSFSSSPSHHFQDLHVTALPLNVGFIAEEVGTSFRIFYPFPLLPPTGIKPCQAAISVRRGRPPTTLWESLGIQVSSHVGSLDPTRYDEDSGEPLVQPLSFSPTLQISRDVVQGARKQQTTCLLFMTSNHFFLHKCSIDGVMVTSYLPKVWPRVRFPVNALFPQSPGQCLRDRYKNVRLQSSKDRDR